MKTDVQAVIGKFRSLSLYHKGLLSAKSSASSYSYYYNATGALLALYDVGAISEADETAIRDYFNEVHSRTNQQLEVPA